MDKDKHASKRSRDRDGRHHRDSDRHHNDRDSHRRSDHRSSTSRRDERERSFEREGSRDRKHREGSYEEFEARKKRKEREESEERGEKRSKLGEENRKEKRERRRFGDKAKEDDEIELFNGASGGDPVHNIFFLVLSLGCWVLQFLSAGVIVVTFLHLLLIQGCCSGIITEDWSPPSYQDGSSSIGKSGANFSLDALAKAKKALQMQKELAEKMKKIPILNRGPNSSSVVATGTVQRPASSVTTANATGPSSSSAEPATAPVVSSKPPTTGVAAVPGLASIPNLEAVKRAQELAAEMGFRQFAPLINMFPGQVQVDVPVAQKPTKAPVLRVDALGREIDEHGNIINVTKPSNLSTLKVNINKQKKDAFQILKPELEVDPESNPHFDERMGINKNKLLRPKRMSFQFVEEGKWSKDAEIIKLKSQFGEAKAKELKAKQAQLAKAKADINPNLIEVSERIITKEKPKDPIPEIEWWDLPLLVSGSYDDIADGVLSVDKLKEKKITIYVEHPRPIEPPAEPAPPPPQPLKLTKKEQKKLRTQRRLAREKDKQEMIRQGLIEPPKPKVKLSNLMKVLGSEATQDPTKLEMEIRSAAAEREQAHVDRNIARKLTPAERREKKERKLFDDPNTVETIVSVYRVNDLSHPKTRFKVDVNAQENRLTGCAVISEGISVVVVEGGSKSIKRYGKLMLRRINWAEAVNETGDRDEDDDEEKPPNKCVLVWQGSVAKSSFNRFSVHECITEAAARKVFSDAGVGHYWDLVVNFSENDF
ncbi:protein RDM16-like isoform X1 [Hibiscus syriacus]|uniref:protein RDM16-like isoform X1 n=2 Tax=Hibiscus syriacus TaxID=106335 RepID=UPI001924935E|nr:protein RDM16-like isoform X1 [Hibiscus syriacus]